LLPAKATAGYKAFKSAGLWPAQSLTFAAGLWPVKKVDNRPANATAGYKACNMLTTCDWRSMLKLKKLGEYSSILTNVSTFNHNVCKKVSTSILTLFTSRPGK
jgi:hypothetical protein